MQIFDDSKREDHPSLHSTVNIHIQYNNASTLTLLIKWNTKLQVCLRVD